MHRCALYRIKLLSLIHDIASYPGSLIIGGGGGGGGGGERGREEGKESLVSIAVKLCNITQL